MYKNDMIITFHETVLRSRMDKSAGVKTSGSGCSKLTTSLVNVSLKFQTSVSEICQNISVFGYKFVKHLTSCPLNELVKLTML